MAIERRSVDEIDAGRERGANRVLRRDFVEMPIEIAERRAAEADQAGGKPREGTATRNGTRIRPGSGEFSSVRHRWSARQEGAAELRIARGRASPPPPQAPTLASTSARRKRSMNSMNSTEGTSRISAVIEAT